eukprot:jgi/Botrbrau1/11245/Bobra.0038s0017.1
MKADESIPIYRSSIIDRGCSSIPTMDTGMQEAAEDPESHHYQSQQVASLSGFESTGSYPEGLKRRKKRASRSSTGDGYSVTQHVKWKPMKIRSNLEYIAATLGRSINKGMMAVAAAKKYAADKKLEAARIIAESRTQREAIPVAALHAGTQAFTACLNQGLDPSAARKAAISFIEVMLSYAKGCSEVVAPDAVLHAGAQCFTGCLNQGLDPSAAQEHALSFIEMMLSCVRSYGSPESEHTKYQVSSHQPLPPAPFQRDSKRPRRLTAS